MFNKANDVIKHKCQANNNVSTFSS